MVMLFFTFVELKDSKSKSKSKGNYDIFLLNSVISY